MMMFKLSCSMNPLYKILLISNNMTFIYTVKAIVKVFVSQL